ncbi:hypothetical protein F4604DRAFT_1923341 [Suillus subluteus]|nr:hypothetical protein F4604DRAFT_1923341 [Suillus subluteus]
MSNVPEAPADSLFPIPNPTLDRSEEKIGRHSLHGTMRRTTGRSRQRRQPSGSCVSHERAAMSHSIPGKSSTVIVFEWQPNDEFGGFCQRVCLTKAKIPMTWMLYSASTRDLCNVLDPSSIPNGDWEEDQFPTPSEPTPAPPPPPPPLSSFLRDIKTYFGCYEVAPLVQYTRNVERFVSILHFHLGYCLAASTSTPRGRSTAFDDWTHKTQWAHLCKLVGNDPAYITSIPDVQKHIITCFIGYLVTLPLSQFLERKYLSFLCTTTQAAALHHRAAVVNSGALETGDITKIAHNLLEKGIAIKTLQPISVAPHAQRPLMELHTYSLGHVLSPKDRRLPHFRPVYADYIMYEQHCHEFMNQPHARVALLHGGLIWQLALHSLGFDVLPSALDSISREAVPFGLTLDINGQAYFDDELSEGGGFYLWDASCAYQ